MRQTQMYQRLLLLYLLDLRSSPTVLPSLLSHPVETMAGPSKAVCVFLCIATLPVGYVSSSGNEFQTACGGPGGSRTRVQNAFTLKGLQQFLT